MADKVNLDAMIPRADFAVESEATSSGEKIQSLGIEQLSKDSLVMRNLRKPDFQRETNHWTPKQIVSFLKSYVDKELIPSVILWQSPSHIFAIDGAHRLSALRAWIEDDYGDGTISKIYYDHKISEAQTKIAKRVRRAVESEIGKFKDLKEAVGVTEGFPESVRARASHMATRSFSLQWVEGDAEKAETSFFKINTQGTPLHKTEERLLRDRKKPLAISARAIVRAATGNKYWSHFEEDIKDKIETQAKSLHNLLFQPEVNEPIKSLDLPLGGNSSQIDALNLLMDTIEIVVKDSNTSKDKQTAFMNDADGQGTLDTLKSCLSVMKRITGDSPGSLGLHPAVYFYNHRGTHNQHLFLAIVDLFSEKLKNNDKQFFQKFSVAREALETFLTGNKPLLSQAIVNIGSAYRVPRLKTLIFELINIYYKGGVVNAEEVFKILKLEGKLVAGEIKSHSNAFSRETKSEIYLKQSLKSAFKCPICKGLIDSKAISYDHVERVRDGGGGEGANGQITHPYCNTGVKN